MSTLRLREDKHLVSVKTTSKWHSQDLNPGSLTVGFLGGSDGKESTCNVGDPGLTLASGRSPGEGNGNHSCILAWKIPWAEEPGGLQSMGWQRVRHDWVTNTYKQPAELLKGGIFWKYRSFLESSTSEIPGHLWLFFFLKNWLRRRLHKTHFSHSLVIHLFIHLFIHPFIHSASMDDNDRVRS